MQVEQRIFAGQGEHPYKFRDGTGEYGVCYHHRRGWDLDVYKRQYQLYAKEITREGRGDLFARFEKLRNELEDMGMFDGCYKPVSYTHLIQ